MTEKEFISTALELRRLAEDAKERLFDFLFQHRNSTWWHGVGETYAGFLEKNNICKAARYLKYEKLRLGLGDVVCDIPVDVATDLVARLPSPTDQRDAIDEIKVWQGVNGTSISSQSAARIVRDKISREVVRETGHRGYNAIAAENKRLREEVAKLRDENARLKAEIKLSRSASSKTTKSKAPKRRVDGVQA